MADATPDRATGSLASSTQSTVIGPTKGITLSLSGTWTGTVVVQRYINGGWRNVTSASYTANTETQIQVGVRPYRVRLDFTRNSGTLEYEISTADDQVMAVAAPATASAGGGDASLAEQQTQSGYLATISGAVRAEDEAHATGDAGIMPLAVRTDSPEPLAADGDYVPFITDAMGMLWVVNLAEAVIGTTPVVRVAIFDDNDTQITSFSGGTQYSEDDAVPTNPTGTAILAEVDYTLSALTPAEGDWSHLRVNNVGALWVNFASGATSAKQDTIIGHLDGLEGLLGTIDADTGTIAGLLGTIDADTGTLVTDTAAIKGHVDGIESTLTTIDADTGGILTAVELLDNIVRAEDEASAGGHSGAVVLARRTDTPANQSGTDGDYEFLQISAGRLWVSGIVTSVVPGTGATALGKAEDAVHSDGDTGVMALAVRKNAGGANSGADGDYEALHTDAFGALHVRASQDQYETVAASQTDQALGATGAAGDILEGVLIIPASTTPGAVSIKDGAGSAITIFVGGASSVLSLHSFFVPLGIRSTGGAWSITTGANVSCIAVGRFT